MDLFSVCISVHLKELTEENWREKKKKKKKENGAKNCICLLNCDLR